MRWFDTLEYIRSYSEKIVAEYDIPAVSLAVWRNDQLLQAASGILNLETGVRLRLILYFKSAHHQSDDHLLGDAVSG